MLAARRAMPQLRFMSHDITPLGTEGPGAASTTRRSFLAGAAAGATLALAPSLAHAASPLAVFRPSGSGAMSHAAFAPLLAAYVRPDTAGYNRVDYAAFKSAGHAALKAYVATLQAAAPSRFGRAEAMAYWINLYNARTLDVVLDRYPVSSIKKINLGGGGIFGGGPWSKPLMTVEGRALSLDDIEHRIVRPLFGDPMCHYALNCASYSCPNLATEPYTGENAGRLMADSARAYINHPRGLSIDGGAITASRIYAWYAGDFGGRDRLKPHWKTFAGDRLASRIDAARIAGYSYDWTLNDV